MVVYLARTPIFDLISRIRFIQSLSLSLIYFNIIIYYFIIIHYLLIVYSDLADQRVVSSKEGELFAKKHHMTYLETSAETSGKVEKAFEVVSQEVYHNIKIGSIVPNSEVSSNYTY